ncbi:hypothetical protein [Thermodesulfovibrio thiophilus]|uniref:hypothetical protein n=1 Tax=Thermodesulfovibrio thiophilus TaxID=340095 RepID=UPI000688A151|nr:hypothetical protein [Thermodesulfovibrio thiophilus]
MARAWNRIVDENFKLDDIFTIDLMGKHLSEKYQHLPIDTKYFKDLELEILSQFEDLDKLYPKIDIAETLSNLTGKWIKKITPFPPLQEGNYEVEFEDGTKIDTKNLDYRLIKPLIWWE